MSDRELERDRYDASALRALSDPVSVFVHSDPPHLREPYVLFHDFIREVGNSGLVALELGAGTGLHTDVVTRSFGSTLAVDISLESLRVAQKRISDQSLLTICADMEAIPVPDSSVDVVVSAGALSYADPVTLDLEIRRILRPGGALIVVDSLNHNPVFKANRWLHYRRGERTLSTLKRMPTQKRLAHLMQGFESVRIHRFGSYVYLYPGLRTVVGAERAGQLCVALDHRLGQGRNAFKFVLLARGYRSA